MKLSIKHILPHTYLSFTKEDFNTEDFVYVLDLLTSKSLYTYEVNVTDVIGAIKECISNPEVILIVVKVTDAKNIEVIGITNINE